MNNSKLIGRYISEDNLIKHIWTGSGIEFDTYSPELVLNVLAEYDRYEIWLAVELNGSRILRTMLLPGMNTIPVYKNLSPDTKRSVRIIRDSQPYLDEDSHYMSIINLTDFNGSPIATEKPADRAISIEFIGDSITTGEGLKGATEDMDYSFCYFSFDGNYAQLTSKSLSADYSVISQCGYGVVCGWNNNPSMNMQDVYKYSDGKHLPYDFAKNFDYVVINLGSNDNGALHQPPFNGYSVTKQTIVEGVKNFLTYVKNKNPNSKIIWMVGMCSLEIEEDIKETIEDLNHSDIYFLRVESNNTYDNGSRNHPGPITHKEAANLLIAKIKEIN